MLQLGFSAKKTNRADGAAEVLRSQGTSTPGVSGVIRASSAAAEEPATVVEPADLALQQVPSPTDNVHLYSAPWQCTKADMHEVVRPFYASRAVNSMLLYPAILSRTQVATPASAVMTVAIPTVNGPSIILCHEQCEMFVWKTSMQLTRIRGAIVSDKSSCLRVCFRTSHKALQRQLWQQPEQLHLAQAMARCLSWRQGGLPARTSRYVYTMRSHVMPWCGTSCWYDMHERAHGFIKRPKRRVSDPTSTHS